MDTIVITQTTSYNYLDYWRKTDSHLCNDCWIKKHKNELPSKQDIKQLPLKDMNDCPKTKPRITPMDYTDDDNPYSGDYGGWPPNQTFF